VRKSREYEQKSKKSAAPGILLVLLLGVAIYFFVAGSMGKWIGENVVQPVFSFFEQGEEIPSPSDFEPSVSPMPTTDITKNNDDAVTKKINTPAISVFALQTGAFSDVENAENAAALLTRKGGAGYVINDGELNRVLLSCYFEDNEAVSVMSRLESEENISTRQYLIEVDPVNIEITAKETTIETINQGFEYIPVLIENIQKAGYAFDRYEYDACDKLIEDTKTKLNGVIYELEKKTDGTNNQVVLSELELLKSYMNKLENIDLTVDDMVAISSEIKYTQIDMIYDYKNLIEGF